MVDTITLSLNIRDPQNPINFDPKRACEWSPHIDHIIAGGRSKMHGKTCICHYRPPLEKEKQSGEYFPKVKLLEVIRPNGIQQLLYITFSAPKLIFSNNFNELKSHHIKLVCKKLSQQLLKMGISVSPKTLQTANVSQIHYSKNILLIGQTIGEVFTILRKAQPLRSKSYRYEKYSSYLYNGQSIHVYTKHHGLCFYDEKAASRNNKLVPNELYSDAWELPDFINVLRIESRCNNPADIRKTLKWAGLPIPKSLTLKELFSANISKAVLLKEFETYRTYLPPLEYTGSLFDIVKSIKTHNPNFTTTDIINATLLIGLINEFSDAEEVRTLLGMSSATWHRRMKLLDRLRVMSYEKSEILDKITHRLQNFTTAFFGEKELP